MRHTKKLITLAGIAAFVTYWFYPPTYPVYPKSDHYDPDTQTFYNAEPQRAPINVASALWEMTFYSPEKTIANGQTKLDRVISAS